MAYSNSAKRDPVSPKNKKPTNLLGQAKRIATKFRPKIIGGGISTVFCYSFRPEVVNDVISGVVVDQTGTDASVKIGDSRSNRSRGIRAAHFVMDE